MKAQCYTFKGLFIALVCTFLSIAVHAQRISGTVLDADTDEPLIGASISVKNAGRGTVSDATGSFKLDAKAGEQLVISYVGYEPQEIALGEGLTLTIKLAAQNQLMK